MADSFAWLLVDVAWKSTVILGIAHLADFLFLRRRPLAADTLWMVALAMLALLPVLGAALPRGTLTLTFRSNAPALATLAEARTPAAVATTGVPLPPPSDLDSANRASRDERVVSQTSSNPGSTTPRLQPPKMTLSMAAVGIYLTVALMLTLRTANSLRLAARLRRNATPVSGQAWIVQLVLLQGRLGISRPVSLLCSSDVQVPITMGWRRPAIVLPACVVETSSRNIVDATLMHELTHIARRDYPVFLGSHLLRCVYWFNPLAWLAVRRVNEVRETVCDCYCVSALAGRGGYVAVLLEFARMLPQRAPAALGLAMARSSRLEKRLESVNVCAVDRPVATPRVRRAALAVAALAATLTSLTALKAETGVPALAANSSAAIPKGSEVKDAKDKAEEAKGESVAEPPPATEPLPSDDPSNLELANRLLEAQEEVAELKRLDFVESGMAAEVRPKFALALQSYEQLRAEVLQRRLAARPAIPPAAEGKDYELYFDGVTSFVELPTLKYNGENPYTIEAIVSPEPMPGPKVNAEIHSYAHYMAIAADTEFGGIELGFYPNRMSFEVKSMPVGWYEITQHGCLPFVERRMHVAAVLDGEELRLYQNGKLVGQAPFNAPVGVSPFTMRIGCSPHPVTECHEMFRGRIDEVRFSEDAHYDDEFKSPDRLEIDDATVALYHFDEGQGEQVKDASPNGHDGLLHDARWAPVGE